MGTDGLICGSTRGRGGGARRYDPTTVTARQSSRGRKRRNGFDSRTGYRFATVAIGWRHPALP